MPTLKASEQRVEVGVNLSAILQQAEARLKSLEAPMIDITPEDPTNG